MQQINHRPANSSCILLNAEAFLCVGMEGGEVRHRRNMIGLIITYDYRIYFTKEGFIR